LKCPEILRAVTSPNWTALREISLKKLQKPEDYRRPGEPPLTIPGVEGVKVYVLGPPKDYNSFV